MAVALYSTKLSTFLESGLWKMAHEARTELSMIMCTLFLLMVGAGAWSLDARLRRKAEEKKSSATTPSPA